MNGSCIENVNLQGLLGYHIAGSFYPPRDHKSFRCEFFFPSPAGVNLQCLEFFWKLILGRPVPFVSVVLYSCFDACPKLSFCNLILYFVWIKEKGDLYVISQENSSSRCIQDK